MNIPRSRGVRGARAAALALAVALPLGACGDKPADEAPTSTSMVEVKRMERPEGGKLAWRGKPMNVGMKAPTVEGLPDRHAVIVFFRGTW